MLRHLYEITPNDIEHKTSNVPHNRYNYPGLPIFTPFCSTASRCSITGHFETSAPNDPKMSLSTKRSKVPIYVLQLNRSPHFTRFCFMASHFSVTGNFETSALNDPKWNWTLKGQGKKSNVKLPHMHVTDTPESQISLLFVLRLVFFFFFLSYIVT